MTPLERKPLRRNSMMNGSPRHFLVVCANACGFRGQRTADKAEDVPLGRRCPRCGSTVKPVGS